MGWETFKRARWRSPSEPSITVTSSGRVTLNVAIINGFLEDNKFATLMFDREKRLVGIRLSKTADSTTYPIFVNKPKSSAAINCYAFLKNYDIIPSITTNYKAGYDKKGRLLTFSVES